MFLKSLLKISLRYLKVPGKHRMNLKTILAKPQAAVAQVVDRFEIEIYAWIKKKRIKCRSHVTGNYNKAEMKLILKEFLTAVLPPKQMMVSEDQMRTIQPQFPHLCPFFHR